MTTTETTTNDRVKQRYFPKSGIDIEVDGMISIRTRKKKISDNIIDIVKETLIKKEKMYSF